MGPLAGGALRLAGGLFARLAEGRGLSEMTEAISAVDATARVAIPHLP